MDVNKLIADLWKSLCSLQGEVKIMQTGGTFWNISGNIGITPEDFLGTVDSRPIVFKTDSVERMRLTEDGSLGIKTDTPTADLDLNGQIRIRGGNPGAGKILQSDANGLATWETPAGITITANNGLIVSSGFVQLGSPVVGGANLLHNTYVNNNGFEFSMYDGPTDLTFRVDPVNGYYQLGKNIVNGAYASFDATANQFTIQAANANYINLDGTNSIFKVVMQMGFSFLELDATAQTYKIGDNSASGAGNNNYMLIDDGNQKVTFFKSQLRGSGYGTGAFTGTPTYTLQVDSNGNIIEGTVGSVTSVGLSMPSPAFSVSGSPVTGSGTLTVTATGTSSQYIRGDGTLATLPVVSAAIGLSLAGTQVVLGQAVGDGTNPALINTTRQIPITIGAGMLQFTAPTNNLLANSFTANSHSIQGTSTVSPTFQMLNADNGYSIVLNYQSSGDYYKLTTSTGLVVGGSIAINTTAVPTAQIHVAAGSATAGTSPMKFTAGTLMTTPEAGAMEFDTHLYFTIGSTRYQLDQQVSASNGISVNSGVIQLGGNVITPTTLTMATGGDRVTFTGASNNTAFGVLQAIDNGVGQALLVLQSNASGKGISCQHTVANGVAINALSSSGIAVSALDNGAGIGLAAYSETGIPVTVISNVNNNNATSTGLRLTRNNGTPSTGGGVGMGIDILVQLEDASGSGAVTNASKISTYWTDATAGSENSSMDFWTINNGTFDSKLSIKDTGKIQLTKYGSGTFTGTATYYLQVTSAGDIIEQDASLTPIISTGTAAPAITPSKVGDVFIDTTNKKLYFATGTSSSADWTIAN